VDGHHPAELATVRYTEYDYWNVLSGGTRLAADAATRIRAGVTPFGVPNERVLAIDDGARVVAVFFTDTVLDQLDGYRARPARPAMRRSVRAVPATSSRARLPRQRYYRRVDADARLISSHGSSMGRCSLSPVSPM